MTSKTSAKRITAAERRCKAVELRIQGKTFAQIGAALSISGPRAYQLVREALAMLTSDVYESAEVLRALEAMRLDELHAGVWCAAIGGNLAAIDRVLRIMERRAKLLGLDAPVKVAPTNPVGDNPYEQLSEAEVDRRLAVILAKYSEETNH